MRSKEEIKQELKKLYKGREGRQKGNKTVEELIMLESRQGRYYVGEAEGWIQALEWVLGKRKKP